MAKDLWDLRQKKKMTVKQLASRSGVKAGDIYAYESGDPVRMADLEKLAKALYVNSNEIKIQSDPIPKKKKKPAAAPVATKSVPTQPPAQPAEKPAQPRQAQRATPATEGQINHLLELAQKVGHSEVDVSERAGKPLAELTSAEAKTWLATYTQECQDLRPDDTRVKRTYLPESVDTFELDYLTKHQEAKTMMTFRLLDKSEFSGVIIGFSPYAITIQQADGRELTLEKLALAYFMTEEAAS